MSENVWLYLVVSSDAQEETLEAQRRWGFEEAARIGATVDPNGIFEGVATGKHGARRILLDLIDKLTETPKAQRPSRVLMARLDRTGRMPLDAISALNDIRKLGVTVRDRINGDYTFQRVIDQVGPIFQLLQAGFENEVRSDRGKAAHKRRLDEGKLFGAKPAYGIMRDSRGFAIPDPECAPVVREVFERWANLESPAEIVVWLMANAPPRKGKPSKRNPTGVYKLQWSLSHVYKMVRLSTYKGVVISEELWERAQKRPRRHSPPGPGGRIYPFSGIKCTCGHTLRARTNNSSMRHVLKSGKVVFYERKTAIVMYTCQSMKHPNGPRFRAFREDRLEEQWVKILKRLAIGKGPWEDPGHSVNLEPRIEMMNRRLNVLLTQRNRIHEAFETGVYDAKTMQERLSKVEAEEKKLQADIEATQGEYEQQKIRRMNFQTAKHLFKEAARLYEHASREERFKVNQSLFQILGHPIVSDGYRIRFK